MRLPSCIHADIHFSVWILVRLLCVDATIPNWFNLSSTRDMVGSTCQARGIWSFCHNPTCWPNPLQKERLAPLARSWKNLLWHIRFLLILPLQSVGAEFSYGQCRICFLPDKLVALLKALYNNSSLFSSSVCLKIFYKWYSQKRKSAVHSMSSLRHIILLIVRNMVKYVL